MNNQEQQFAQLVREHKSTIYTVCYMFSHDEDEVNDLFQETLINMWKGIDSFREESKISTWIYRVQEKERGAQGAPVDERELL